MATAARSRTKCWGTLLSTVKLSHRRQQQWGQPVAEQPDRGKGKPDEQRPEQHAEVGLGDTPAVMTTLRNICAWFVAADGESMAGLLIATTQIFAPARRFRTGAASTNATLTVE